MFKLGYSDSNLDAVISHQRWVQPASKHRCLVLAGHVDADEFLVATCMESGRTGLPQLVCSTKVIALDGHDFWLRDFWIWLNS